MKQLRKSEKKIFAGVCGGIGAYFNIDPTVVRLILCVVTVLKIWLGIIFYVAAALLMPAAESTFDTEFEASDKKNQESDREEKSSDNADSSPESQEDEVPHTDEEFNNFFKNLSKKNK